MFQEFTGLQLVAPRKFFSLKSYFEWWKIPSLWALCERHWAAHRAGDQSEVRGQRPWEVSPGVPVSLPVGLRGWARRLPPWKRPAGLQLWLPRDSRGACV